MHIDMLWVDKDYIHIRHIVSQMWCPHCGRLRGTGRSFLRYRCDYRRVEARVLILLCVGFECVL